MSEAIACIDLNCNWGDFLTSDAISLTRPPRTTFSVGSNRTPWLSTPFKEAEQRALATASVFTSGSCFFQNSYQVLVQFL